MTDPRHDGGYIDAGKQAPVIIDSGCYIPGLVEVMPPVEVLQRLRAATSLTTIDRPLGTRHTVTHLTAAFGHDTARAAAALLAGPRQ